MADLKFLSFFNEVAQDNFVSVVKQNLVFQAQIRLLEDAVKVIPELQKKIEDLEINKTEYRGLVEENTDLKNQLKNKNSIIENTNKSDIEKARIQSALNEKMREVSQFKKTIEDLQKEIQENKEYKNKLQEMLPKTAKKKLGITVEETEKETSNSDNDMKDEIISNGGTF
jgi:chromosome segregation ATPase